MHRQLVRLMGVFILVCLIGILLGGRDFLRSILCFPFSILFLLYFRLAILLWYRTLGDNVLGRGGMWWGKMSHA